MERVAYIVQSTKGYFKGFVAMLTPDEDGDNDNALFVIASTAKSKTLEEAQKQQAGLPADVKVYPNPIKSSENGLSWLSELKEANKEITA
jgi:hypothetical protein